MEQIELKSSQSKFCDSNVGDTTTQTNNACLNIETDSIMNQSVMIDEEKPTMETFINLKDLEIYISNTSKLQSNYQIITRVQALINQAYETIDNDDTSNNAEICFFKRKEALFSLKSIEAFHRIIEKKFFDVNLELVKYFEIVLIYESISELTSDKEILVKLINAIFLLSKYVDNQSVTYLLDYRLQILIKKVLLLNSSNNSSVELLIKNALTPLIEKSDVNDAKKKELSAKITEIIKKKINDQERKDKHDEGLKELADFIKEKFTNSKEHHELMMEPLLEFFDQLNLDVEVKYSMVYEFLCYFIFPLLPNLNYCIFKNETKQENKPFGLYNPVLMIKNTEVSVKSKTILNFIDNNLYDIVPQFNLSFYNLDLLLSKLNEINNDENSRNNVNLRFALFVIYKRILLLKDYSHLLNFNYGYAEIEHLKNNALEDKKNKEDKDTINDITNKLDKTEFFDKENNIIKEDSKSKDFHTKFIKSKLTDIIKQHEIIKKISLISLEMFRNKIDSENNEISNFFPYLIKHYEEEVSSTFKEYNFDLTEYIKHEKLNLLIKYIPAILSEKVKISELSAVTEGFINTAYITAGNNKDLLIYVPRNSVFYFTCTITYYDSMINVYKYDANKEGADKFVVLSKEQKIESDFTPFELTIFSYKPEIYKINIDNTFSWMNGKEIKYKYSILQLSEKTKPSEQHKLSLRYKLENFKEQVLNKITEFVFYKYETFLGKAVEEYAKKGLAFNYLSNYSNIWLQKYIGQVKKQEPLSKLYLTQSNVKYLTKLKKNSENKKDDKDGENNEDEMIIPQSLQEVCELDEENRNIQIEYIKKAYKKISSCLSSFTKGKKNFKLDKLASIDVIVRSYIKNVFVRVNLNEEEIEDPAFKSEICKFEDSNDQFIFFNYYYLKQNKECSLGNYFEEETLNNTNIIFMKFPLVESCLIFYLQQLILENSKFPEKAIYFHFDKNLTKYNYAVYSNGEILGDDSCFGEDISGLDLDYKAKNDKKEEASNNEDKANDKEKDSDKVGDMEKKKTESFNELIKRIIDSINFKKQIVDPLKPKKKNIKNKKKSDNDDNSDEESEESEDDNDDDSEEEEKAEKLKNWKIVVSFTGSNEFTEEAKAEIKNKVNELNKEYLKEGKTKKEKKIKVVFKSVDFVCDMTNYMHCFELY